MAVLTKFEFHAKEFAQIVGVTPATLINWEDDGMPKPDKPTRNVSYYSLKVHLPWIIENKFKPNQSAKARKLEAETALAEMKRDEQAGALLPAMEVKREWEDFLARLRTNLRGFTDRLIPLLEETGIMREKLAIGKREMDTILRDIVEKEQ